MSLEKYRAQHDADLNEIIETLEAGNYHDIAQQYRTLANRLSEKDMISCLNVHHMTKTFFLWKLRDMETRLHLAKAPEAMQAELPQDPQAEREISLLKEESQRYFNVNCDLQAEIKRLEQQNQELNDDAMIRYNRKANLLKEFYFSTSQKK
jgi:hypothetical protein